MSKIYVIDSLLPQIKEVDAKDIIDGCSGIVVTINIKYGQTVIPTVVWNKNIFDDELLALLAYRDMLNDELIAIKYKINSLDKIEEEKKDE